MQSLDAAGSSALLDVAQDVGCPGRVDRQTTDASESAIVAVVCDESHREGGAVSSPSASTYDNPNVEVIANQVHYHIEKASEHYGQGYVALALKAY